jgi:putative oxidoreductase
MLNRFLEAQTERAYALLRIVSGLLFTFHGFQKLFGFLGGHLQSPGSQLWFGAIIEVVCGLAIAFGAFTRWAGFLASGTMAVAYVQFHWKLRFDAAFFPAINQGELAVIDCFLFLLLACKGGGEWSVDSLRSRGEPSPTNSIR